MNSKRSVSSVSSVIASIGLTLFLSACAGTFQDQSAQRPPVPDLEDPTQRAASLLRYCRKLRKTDDLQLAAGICQRAHKLDPTDPEPLLELAGILLSLGMTESAAEAYRSVVLLDPQRVDALYGLGKIHIDSQRYDLAQLQLEQAMLADDSDPRIYNALGVVMDQQGDHMSAQAYYHSGLKKSPRNPSLRNNLGLSLVLAGDPDAGLALLREVAAEPGVGATASRNLAIANQKADVPENDPPSPPRISAVAVEPQASLEPTPPATPLPLLKTSEPEAPRLAATESRKNPPTAETAGTVTQALVPQEEELPDTAADFEYSAAPAAPVISTTPPIQTAEAVAPAPSSPPQAFPAHASPPAPHDLSEEASRRPHRSPTGTSLPVQTAGKSEPPAVKSAAAKVPDSGEWIHSVQLSSFDSARGARRSWEIIRDASADLLAGLDIVILRADLGVEKGIVYRVRTDPMDWQAATRLCTQLKGKGLDCLTVKASRQETIEATVERICALNAAPGTCAAPLSAPLRNTSLPARHPSTS